MLIFDHIIFYKIGKFLAESIPVKLSYFIAERIADIYYLFAFQDQKEVAKNLRVIFPERKEKELRRIRTGLFRNFAKYLVDFFRFEKISQDYIQKKVQVENIAYLKEALSANKGVINVTAHLGNWELGGIAVALMGYPIFGVALPHQDKQVDEFFNRQREIKGLKVIPLSQAVSRSLSLLKENKIVALVADRDFTQQGICIDFFNKPTIFPSGPAIFSLRTKAPILPVFLIRKKQDYFVLKFEKPIYPLEGKDMNDNIRDIIYCYKTIFEEYIKKYPQQWYMFRKFWKEDK